MRPEGDITVAIYRSDRCKGRLCTTWYKCYSGDDSDDVMEAKGKDKGVTK